MEYALEGDLKSFGKGFTVIEQARAQTCPTHPWTFALHTHEGASACQDVCSAQDYC